MNIKQIKPLGRNRYKWKLIVEAGRVGGKRKRHTKVFEGTESEAKKAWVIFASEVQRGIYVEPSALTTGEYLIWWLEQHSRLKNLAPATVESYRGLFTVHIIPLIGGIPLSKLQPIHIQSCITSPENLSPRTRAYMLSVVRRALKHAVTKYKLIPSNPADAVESPTYQRVKYQVLDPDAANRLLEAAQGTADYPIIFTLLYTGMRRGEALALRWENVDLETGVAVIKETMGRVKGEGLKSKSTKTEAGIRTVALSPEVTALFAQIKKEQEEKKLKSEYVFCTSKGTPIDPRNFTRRFKRLRDKLGLDGFRPHDLRHTHASLLLGAGVELHTVQERLGHRRASITADIYGHALPGKQKQAAEKFSKLLGKKEGTGWAPDGQGGQDKSPI